MKQYRVAIIGLGGMGRHHAEAVRAEGGCELVAGAEIDAARGRAWGEEFGVAAVYADYEKLLDQVAPDIALIATQAPQHHGPALAAARRGIHVFCEKPTALDLAQADEMVAACDAAGVKFAINHIKRASPYNRLAAEMIARGDIGRLVRMRAFDKGGRFAGNSLMEMGTHLYDWLRLFGGDVEWAHAHLMQADGRESGVDDIRHSQEVHPEDRDAGLVLGERCCAAFRFRGGVHAEVDFLGQAQTDDRAYGIDLIGSEGRIAVRESVQTSMFFHEGQHMAPDQPWQRVRLAEEDRDAAGGERDRAGKRLLLQRLMLRDLVAAIEEDRDPRASGRDGRDCLEMIHATWESHRQGRRVSVPLTSRDHPLERWREEEGQVDGGARAGESGPDRDEVRERIVAFLGEIGLDIRSAPVPADARLPGIHVESGVLLFDPERLTYPGDLLHEAGHLAVFPPAERAQMGGDFGDGWDMAAMAWSYAACVHLSLSPAIVFHEAGYQGTGVNFIENFDNGRYVGVPLLDWRGMTATEGNPDPGIPRYPEMSKWLCD